MDWFFDLWRAIDRFFKPSCDFCGTKDAKLHTIGIGPIGCMACWDDIYDDKGI